MASPHSFTTIAERELNDPDAFLPTSMRYEGQDIIWTKPGYATYRGTPSNHEMADSTILCNPDRVILPPNLDRISKSKNATEHQKRYVHDFKFAAASIDHWKESKHPNEVILADAISIWKTTCDKLTTNPYFTEGWYLPAFYPIYSYQCAAGIQIFFETAPVFHPDKKPTFWKKQIEQSEEMFNSWEALYYHVTSGECIPFPKCLWYHKYHYIHQRKQADTWKRFFNNSSFKEWGTRN
mmetsp:Transcript_7900/g.11465  ORF Transcript_7900/g.11465 Transcript_7900/m.11465 type:complete len:238 (-) Transcript_7900:191-904(-)